MAPRRKYKKKRYRRRRKNNYNMAVSMRSPIPRMFKTKMRFCDHIYLDPGIGTISTQQFSCNGLYDPSEAVGNHQPYGYDQLAVLYDHYTVLGAKITVQCSPNPTATVPYIFGLYIDDNSTAASNYNTVQEIPENRWVVCHPTQTKTFSKSVSISKFLGIKDLLSNKEARGNTVGANPAEQCYFTLWCKTADETTNNPTANFIVNVEYIVVFTEPKELTGSS